MDSEQITMIEALNRCTFAVGSYQKRFVRDMSTMPHDKKLSDKQSLFLDKLYWLYRKQISASEFYDPDTYPPFEKPIDFKKIEAEQRRIAEWNAKVSE